jgi:probable F420-dependent oxidoreductase
MAESLRFERILLPDHPGSMASPIPLLAAVASVTSSIKLGTYVLNTGVRHPALVAADIATLDALSGGRAVLGLGAGHTPSEWQLVGRPYPAAAERVGRLAEFIDVTSALLAGGPVTCRGSHFECEAAVLSGPRPVQPRIPLLVGGNGDRVMRLAGQHADIVSLTGFGRTLPDGHAHEVRWSEEAVARKVALVREAAAHRVRPPLVEVLVQHVEVTAHRWEVAERLSAGIAGLDVQTALNTPFLLIGSAVEIADQVRGWEARLGVSSWVIRHGHARDVSEVMSLL